jgi:hypothetical protein
MNLIPIAHVERRYTGQMRIHIPIKSIRGRQMMSRSAWAAVPQPGQGMDTKELSLLIDSICRCNGVVWCPLWCPLGPQNWVHSSETVELDEQSEICEIVHSA